MNNSLEFLPRPTLSLCAIVKNEKNNLPRCLASVKPYVDEMVVVDTGSEDGTPEIAAQYGAKVGHFEWCYDFSAARNYSLSLASGDWILMLDADEELIVKSSYFWEKLTLKPEIIAYSIIRTEAGAPEDAPPLHTIRLFRNIPELRFRGRLHEDVKYQSQENENIILGELDSIRILHYGNKTKEEIFEKFINRDLTILERARQEEGLSLKLLYCLAGIYRDTQQTEKADECYGEAFERLLPNLMEGNRPNEFAFIPSMIFTLVMRSLQEQDYETARLLCQRGLEWCPDYPPLLYITGVTLRALGFPLGAIAYFEKCIELGRERNYYKWEPFEQNYMTTYPACDIGAAYMDMQRTWEAIAAFEVALSFDANCTVAQQQLDKIGQFLNLQA